MDDNIDAWPVHARLLWRDHYYDRLFDNTCVPIQSVYPDRIDAIGVQLSFAAVYAIVWLLAVAGNLFVLYIAAFKRSISFTVSTVFISSLACSDIIMSVTSLPVTAVTILSRDWLFPTWACQFGVFQGGSIFISSFTLTAIAIDRYFLIVHPSREVRFQFVYRE